MKKIVAKAKDVVKSKTFPGRVSFRTICPHCNLPTNDWTFGYEETLKEKMCAACGYEYIIDIPAVRR